MVAVKMVAENPLAQQAFLEEAVMTWQFRHPNVVGMHGVVTKGVPYLLVLELCETGFVRLHLFPSSHSVSLAASPAVFCSSL